MSSVITNRAVKAFIEAYDFYPGFKLEEECFSKAIIKDVDQKSSKKKSKSDLDEGPITWPRLKATNETGYEKFLEEVINPKTGEFYPQRDKDNTAIKNTGATYYITDIYRIRRPDGSEFLYTKGRVDAFTSLGDPVNHFISKPEIWTKTNFSYKSDWNEKTKQVEKVLQGPSGHPEIIYRMPFTKENLKSLYDRRENDLVNFVVIQEGSREARMVEEVNAQKRFELFQKDFSHLWNGDYISPEQKAAYRQEAIDRGWIQSGGNIPDYSQPSKSPNTTAKNTYQ